MRSAPPYAKASTCGIRAEQMRQIGAIAVVIVLMLWAGCASPSRQVPAASERFSIKVVGVENWPFGDYDRAFASAVNKRWYALKDSYHAKLEAGTVVVQFRQHSDGHVSDLKVTRNDVAEAFQSF